MKKTIMTMDQLRQFSKPGTKTTWRTGDQIVSYTRVSDPSQFDNSSLETQKKEAIKQAKRKGFNIKQFFGGTVESAKTDERKEFKKMLAYVRRDISIVAILVYSYERFSRSKNAGYLTRELAKIGVQVLSVFQDIDVKTASGQLQQDIFYAFGNYDNVLRRDKTTQGMIENLRNGFWVAAVPFGYTNLNRKEKAKYHNYIINKDGEYLKLGFKWKGEGKLSNLEIVKKLHALGCTINYKSFVRIISNPFYCGYITHSLIPNEIIKGRHPSLVSEDVFLKANGEVLANPHKGISKKYKNDAIPLKSFMKDDNSDIPFTGYLKKGNYYYKTRGKCSPVNERADLVNNLFKAELEKLSIQEKHKDKIATLVLSMINEKIKDQAQLNTSKKKKVTELTQDIDRLELRFIKNDIDKDLYQKYRSIFKEEKDLLEKEIESSKFDSSNLENAIKKTIDITGNPLQIWLSSDYDDKQRLQYLIFPDGIRYNKKNKVVRTPKINSVFTCVAEAARVLMENKKGYSEKNSLNSHWVVPPRIELGSKV